MLIVVIVIAALFAGALQIWALCAIAHDADGPGPSAEAHMPRRASM
jgi:hypothetical protein